MNNELRVNGNGDGDGGGYGDGYGNGNGDGGGYSHGHGDGIGLFANFESNTYLLSLLRTNYKESVEFYVALLNSETQEEKDSILGILELKRDHHAHLP